MMATIRNTAVIFMFMLSLPAVGVAQSATDSSGGGTPEETTYNFDDDVVEGQLLRPDGDLIGGRRHGKESNLIDIRSDFIPEMVRSAEQL